MMTSQKIRRFTPHQRQQYVEEFNRSGLSQAEFCRRVKLQPMTFSRWRRSAAPVAPVEPVFAEVQVRSSTTQATSEVGGAAVLHLRDGAKLEVALAGETAWAGLGLMLKSFQA